MSKESAKRFRATEDAVIFDEAEHQFKTGAIDQDGEIVGPTEPVDIAEKLGHPVMMINSKGPGAVLVTLQGQPTQLLEPGDGIFGEPRKFTVSMKTEVHPSIYFFAREKDKDES